MKWTPVRVLECVKQAPWAAGHCLRLFWIQANGESRGDLARHILDHSDAGDTVIGLPLRDRLFTNGNVLMSDANQFFELHRDSLEPLGQTGNRRLTVVVVAATEFHLSQGGSPVTLPSWFPVSPSRETYFTFEDLGASAQVLLSAPEARLDHISELVYNLESAMLRRIRADLTKRRISIEALLIQIEGAGTVNAGKVLSDYRKHLDAVVNVRGYRPGAKFTTVSLMSRLLGQIVRATPSKIVDLARTLAAALALPPATKIKPAASATLLRTSQAMPSDVMNAHAVLLAVLAAYQAQNAAAHAGDYGTYPVALVYQASADLRRSLAEAVQALTAAP